MPKHILKDGSVTRDSRCSLIFDSTPKPQRFMLSTDNREVVPFERECPRFLDQGREGMCVGAGVTHALISMFLEDLRLNLKFAREKIYWEAQKHDPWPGGDYPGAKPNYGGTTVNAGLKEALKLKYISAFHWAMSAKDALVGIQDGPVVLGLRMQEGMMTPDRNGFIRPVGDTVGGHCIYMEAVNDDYVTIHQSWGRQHGVGGRVFMKIEDFEKAFNNRGEAAILTKGSVDIYDMSILDLIKNFFE